MLLRLTFTVILQNITDGRTHKIPSSWAPVRAKNGVTRVIEYVLLNPDGLHHALALAVPMPFFAGWLEGFILRGFYLKYLFTRALLHG